MYSDLYIHQHSNTPKILLILAVTVVAAMGFFFISSRDSAPTRASQNTLVQHKIVNISPTQVGIFWEASQVDTGWIIYGTSPHKLDMIARDERDKRNTTMKRRFHYSLISNVTPDTIYYYQIVSDNALISNSKNQAFEVKTLKNNSSGSALSPIYGSIIETNGSPVENAFALLDINNAHPVLALTAHTGEWLIPLQYVVQLGSLNSVAITNESVISIQLFDDTRSSLVRSTVERSRPLPEPIRLGNNYSFISDENVLSVQDRVPNSSQSFSNVSIRYPLPNAVIPGTAPLIKGYGVPNVEVLVRIDAAQPISKKTIVGTDGKWSVSVGGSLPPGSYTLEVVTKDAKNTLVTLTRTFTIIKSGEQVLSEHTQATPSGTLTPTSSSSPTIQPTIITFTPSPLPTIVSSLTPTLTPAPPVSGVNMLPFITAGIGLAILAVGTLLLL